MTQGSHFPGLTQTYSTTTNGVPSGKFLQLGATEMAAGLILSYTDDGRFAPSESLACTHMEGKEPDRMLVARLVPFEVKEGTLYDDTPVRCLLYRVHGGIANGVFVWPSDDDRCHTSIGGGSVVYLSS